MGSVQSLFLCYVCSWRRFRKEADEGKGLRIPSWMRVYLKYVLPLIIIAIFIKGYWDIFSRL